MPVRPNLPVRSPNGRGLPLAWLWSDAPKPLFLFTAPTASERYEWREIGRGPDCGENVVFLPESIVFIHLPRIFVSLLSSFAIPFRCSPDANLPLRTTPSLHATRKGHHNLKPLPPESVRRTRIDSFIMGALVETTPAALPTAQHLPPTPPSEAAAPTSAKMTSQPAAAAATAAAERQAKHIWVITGPAGCGKTSVAEHLHTTYDLPYLEGDTYHTPDNVEKMRAGQPLTDADRWDWLILLREEALTALKSGDSGVIVTCSALKRKYRDVLRVAAYHNADVQVHFVFLQASEALLMDRVRARQGHYMKDYMVRSQFQSLETPQADERDVLSVDASGTSEDVQRLAEEVVSGVMGAEEE